MYENEKNEKRIIMSLNITFFLYMIFILQTNPSKWIALWTYWIESFLCCWLTSLTRLYGIGRLHRSCWETAGSGRGSVRMLLPRTCSIWNWKCHLCDALGGRWKYNDVWNDWIYILHSDHSSHHKWACAPFRLSEDHTGDALPRLTDFSVPLRGPAPN